MISLIMSVAARAELLRAHVQLLVRQSALVKRALAKELKLAWQPPTAPIHKHTAARARRRKRRKRLYNHFWTRGSSGRQAENIKSCAPSSPGRLRTPQPQTRRGIRSAIVDNVQHYIHTVQLLDEVLGEASVLRIKAADPKEARIRLPRSRVTTVREEEPGTVCSVGYITRRGNSGWTQAELWTGSECKLDGCMRQ